MKAYYAKPRNLKLFNILLIIFSLLFVNISYSLDSEISPKGYFLNEKEEAILKWALKSDQEAFADGEKTLLFGKDITTAESRAVANDYDANQVAADQKYFKKIVQISGKIISINSGIGNEPYVRTWPAI